MERRPQLVASRTAAPARTPAAEAPPPVSTPKPVAMPAQPVARPIYRPRGIGMPRRPLVGGTPENCLASRARLALEESGLSMNYVDKAAGQGSGYMTRLVRGAKKRPDPQILQRIADLLRVNLRWLATGEGPQRMVGRPPNVEVLSAAEFEVVVKRLGGVVPAARKLGCGRQAIYAYLAHKRFVPGSIVAKVHALLGNSIEQSAAE